MVIQLRLAPVYSAEMRKLQWNQSATYFMEYPYQDKSVYYTALYIMPGIMKHPVPR